MCTRWCYFHLLDLEGLACSPADGGLALDGLSCGFRHCSAVVVILGEKAIMIGILLLGFYNWVY